MLLLPYKIARCWCRSILSPSLDQIFNFFSKLHAEKSGEYYYSRIVLGVTPPFTPTGVGGGHFLVSPLFVLFSYVSPSKADILNQPMKTSQIFVSSTAEKTRGVAERCIRNCPGGCNPHSATPSYHLFFGHLIKTDA